ncbi:hypothetical protein LXL04_022973 [Taraxacum kok-saghyz]
MFQDLSSLAPVLISSMDVKSGEKLLSVSKIDDLKTWLSTALTHQDTCLDALEEMNSTLLADVKSKMQNSTEYASNRLAIVSKISRILGKFNLPIHRKLLGEFPEWVNPGAECDGGFGRNRRCKNH